MRTTITGRHVAVDEALRTRATEVLERLGGLTSRAVEATAVFDIVAGHPAAELRLQCAGGPTLVASADGTEHRSALERAGERLRRQVTRFTSRARRVRHDVAG
ncbi:MAG: HPF/RaiA family ribosome-associated protein [Gemmatimonadales bacterium]|nr:HPF/RaiA family ribosome-associated protein [Gemmatimonadales bacterium]